MCRRPDLGSVMMLVRPGSSACLPRTHKLPHDQKLEWHSRWTRVGLLRDLGGRGGRPAARRFALVLNWFAALGWRLWCRAWDDASVDWTSVRKRRTTIFRKFSILYLGREWKKKTRNGCTRHHRNFSVRLIMEKAPNWVACGPKIAELHSPHWAGNLELFVWSLIGHWRNPRSKIFPKHKLSVGNCT